MISLRLSSAVAPVFGVTTMGRSDGNKANIIPAEAVVSLAIGVSACSALVGILPTTDKCLTIKNLELYFL